MDKKILIIIPARGGSKGIPRKNLRPLCGKPLIAYAIESALQSRFSPRVVVSTEDEEIALFAKRFGANILLRPKRLSSDEIPLDPVIQDAWKTSETIYEEQFQIIITIQPTSPLITAKDIDTIIERFLDEQPDTIMTAIEDRHLRWMTKNKVLAPAYTKRVNRQLLPMEYKETGGVIACSRNQMSTGSRIGKKVLLHVMDASRSIDIDSFHDFWLCEMILRRKKIIFVVIGNSSIGMGHIYRTLMLANECIRDEIIFLCPEEDTLASTFIAQHNYRIETFSTDKILDKIFSLDPDMVINDILNTSADYVAALKREDILVVNFEDMGLGAENADLVINALYPHQIPKKNILVGPDYFCLRDEFLHIQKREEQRTVQNLLISFGGVDEGNLTSRVLQSIAEYVLSKNISISIVLGNGYNHFNDLNKIVKEYLTDKIQIIKSTPNISEFMNNADLAITSAGRTVLELASLNVPTIVIAQNFRETTHTMASSKYGFINLGCRKAITNDTILNSVQQVVENSDLRKTMRDKMQQMDLTQGKKRVLVYINSLFDTFDEK